MNRWVKVYIELIPEEYVGDLSITINCKKSELDIGKRIIDFLTEVVNIEFKKGDLL